MPELADIINEVPASIADPENNPAPEKDEDEVVDEETEDELSDESEDSEDAAEESDEDTDKDAEDEDEDDYFTEEEVKPEPPAPAAPAATQNDDASKFILDGLVKIPVRIVAADDSIQTVEVYGNGDLPRDFKGFATPYEEGVFRAAVTAQEIKARELQNQWSQQQTQKQTQDYEARENAAIAEDLRDLRGDGVFPKFKGNPGTKEFDNSDGAKEFDRVIAFMNERNALYAQRAQSGKAYRHIGFRESFELLNGTNIKADEKKEDSARRKAASKTITKKGTKATTETKAPRHVSSLTDLADEFVPTGV